MIMIKKNLCLFSVTMLTALVLVGCNQPTSSSSSTSAAASSTSSAASSSSSAAKKQHDNKGYAGYECDLNGDGTIADSEKNLTWANSYDKLISTVKSTSDSTLRFKLMHAAETELMSTGAITPIYYYTDIFMKKEAMTGFFSMPLGYKFFYGATLGTSKKFTACIASAPKTIDPGLNSTVDGGTYDEHLFEGLYRWTYEGTYPDGGYKLTPGMAETAPTKVVNADKTVTYTYTIRSGLKWSDGTSLTAHDIERSWKRNVNSTTGSDYCYLFEAIVGGADAEGETDGKSLSVTATDDTHLTVNLVTDIAYWNELTAFPTFAPVPSNADKDGVWCTSANVSTFVCNGPMKISSFDTTSIVLVPNTNYHDTSIVKAEEVTFAFSDDSSAMLNSYKSGSYAFIDDVPVAQIDTLKASNPTEFFNVGQLGTYYICWNINSTVFDDVCTTEDKREKFRKALGLLINRQYIIDSVAKGGQEAANGFVSAGLTDSDGSTQWTAKNGPKGDGSGYYNAGKTTAEYKANVTEAITDLKSLGYTYNDSTSKFTNIPAFEYYYNTSDGHKAIGEAIQGMFAKYGITMTLSNADWATFVDTRKKGEYTVARNGWLADYNDPISYLDMWTTDSGNNDCQFGRNAA
jgi:oligopeptide transport system substrate-binding protein